ncbi:aminotransferase class I/II-fold pyridoxal phosphate-dependent enzyme [Thalassoroseus pseudoceratinae]|uniref:aminotransferase class I/II-fold pyridoxal phosphate-dependent enzyme n=1 Tax=Thalassoroseus pseudoceratinae TaxID=2713176 RepID=UPI00141FE748|nr:aminotransferase class I/II-fold pyridoxal phosphate-dependent enzyme [Thalassoroseus pseudoceratinae]
MWSRKRLDIGWTDFAAGLLGSGLRWNREHQHQAIEQAWSTDRESLVCLSVRSGWDLFLSTLNLPPGSEVLMSALTIPDMARIVEAHGLVPVPLDLDPNTLVPTVESFERGLSERTRIVLVAHLFGTRNDLSDLIAAAHAHNLMFVEDCAQAYIGPSFRGHADSDAVLFSFGTIKTATALGGAVVQIADETIRNAMRKRQAEYAVQSRAKFAQRLVKYAALKFISLRPCYGLFVQGCRMIGRDYNAILNKSVKGFGTAAPIERFRSQPSAPLLGLLKRRIQRPPVDRIERQASLGRRIYQQLATDVPCPGGAVPEHCFWVFPLSPSDPQSLIESLRDAGFDTTQGESLCVVNTPKDRPELDPAVSRQLLERLVYLPLYPALTESACDQMAKIVQKQIREPSKTP